MLKQIVLLINCLLVSQLSYAQRSSKPIGLTGAQSVQTLPNANFNQWVQDEPASWYTNNVYDNQGKLVQAVVIPAGTTGARLLAKHVVYRAETPKLESWYADPDSSLSATTTSG